MEDSNIEYIIKKKKSERTEEEQRIFEKYKKSEWNKKYNSKKKKEIQHIQSDDEEEIIELERKDDHITPEMIEEYVQFRLNKLKEEEKIKPKEEPKTEQKTEPYQESFLEQIARTAAIQLTQLMIPVSLAGLVQILSLYSGSTVQSKDISRAPSQPQQMPYDPFAGTLSG